MKRLTKPAAAIAVMVVVMIATSSSAGATQPERHTFEIDDTFVLEENPCGFPIEERAVGTEQISFHFDRHGNLVRARFQVRHLEFTFTNLETGASVTGVVSSIEHFTVAEEGPGTLRITGLLGHLVVPGVGVVEQESGQVVLATMGPGDPNTTVEKLVGRLDGGPGPFPELCSALEGS